jgi:copper chaperone
MKMETITFKVGGMSCMGCVNSVKRLLSQLPGVARVDVDLASGRVEVDYDPTMTDPDLLGKTIVDGGYQVMN